MTDKIDPVVKEPEESPDFLAAPKRGKGVRRLNRIPLMITAGVLALAVVAITYTFFQRQASMHGVASSPLDAGNVTAPPVAPVNPDKMAGPPTMPTDQVVPEIQPMPGDAAAMQPAPEPAMPPELEARLRLIQRVQEGKLAAWEAALGSEAGVQSFNRSASASNGGGAAGASGGGVDPAASMARLASLGAANQAYGAGAGAGGAGMGMDMGGGSGRDPDPNRQEHKRAFLSGTPEADVYLKHTRQNAVAETEVKAGTVIPGVMIGGINSDLPGQIVGQVRQNVYDSATGKYLLIPAGARLVGTYDSTVTMGQRRVLAAWNRIIYPDGSSVSLDLMPGADQSGYAGFADKTNNHYWRIFGNALLLSAFSGGIQLSQPNSKGDNYSAQEIMTAELGRQLGQLGMETARRNLDIQPTLTIRPGYQFNVMVTKDIILPRWTGHPAARR